MAYVLHTRTTRPYVIVNIRRSSGRPVPTIEGYAETRENAERRARRKGSSYVVASVVNGRVIVTAV